jgi:NADH:ubiquinone oxidoreductase subunit F (NADH-binding)
MTVVATSAWYRTPAQVAGHEPRLLAGLLDGQPTGLNAHERIYGPLPLPSGSGRSRSLSAKASRLIDVVERSGLTGRGGAGFPTGRKLRSVAAGAGSAIVVANGAEGEPASRKDRLLLSRLPHLVLDGISLAAFAVGATRAYLAVHGDDQRLLASLEAAAQARAVAGIDWVPIDVTEIDGGYVASEQTAIVHHITGGPGLPTFSPPRTHQRGVAGRPTLVCNAETLAHLALIARYGDAWFRRAGLPSAPGTTLVTVSGAIARPGVYEIQLGTTVGAILHLAGGPVERPQAILTGGYFGRWLPAEAAWPLPLTRSSLQAAGGALGAGVLVVLPDSSCALAETARVIRYLAGETAGQCGPCVFGLPALADAFADLAYHGGQRVAADRIADLIPLIEGRGACRHPDGATALAASALTAFGDDARWHDERGPCFGVMHQPLLPIPGDVEYW